MSIGKMYLSAMLAEGSLLALTQLGKINHLFKANETPAYEFIREFVKLYHHLPTAETIENHTGETLVPHLEPAAYYFDLMETRHVEFTVKKALKDANDLLLPENKNPDAALKVLTAAAMQLIAQKTANTVVDFRQAYDAIMADYQSKWKDSDEQGLFFGWPYLDKMTGGLIRGDLISFVGRPGKGKTFQMLYGAHYGWNKAGKEVDPQHDQSRLFVSMEMSILAIEQRLAAMQTHVPGMKLKHAKLPTLALNHMRKGLMEIKGYGAPFYVVDGNLTSTVEDIHLLALQLKPAAIFIDGAYLVRHPFERDRYRRVAENCDLIKKLLCPLAPTAASWQFAKTAAKKAGKKGEKVELEDIGFTDAIAMNSSLVLGLFEDDTVATTKQRKVEVLKGRNGETGSFVTNWNFDNMNFSELTSVAVEELHFS
jgi:replicative DNA helicase